MSHGISPVTKLPIIATLIVDGRSVRVSSPRPYNRDFLQRWADDCARKQRPVAKAQAILPPTP